MVWRPHQVALETIWGKKLQGKTSNAELSLQEEEGPEAGAGRLKQI